MACTGPKEEAMLREQYLRNKILKMLRYYPEVSNWKLQEELGVDRQKLWSLITRLRKEGYPITTSSSKQKDGRITAVYSLRKDTSAASAE